MHAGYQRSLKAAVVCAALLVIGIDPSYGEEQSVDPSDVCPFGGIRIHVPNEGTCDELHEAASTQGARKHRYVPFGDMGPFDKMQFTEFLEAHEEYKQKFKAKNPETEWSEKSGYCMICYVEQGEEIDKDELINEVVSEDAGEPGEPGEPVEDKAEDGGPPCPTERCEPRLGNSQPWSCAPLTRGDASTCPQDYPVSNYAETCCREF